MWTALISSELERASPFIPASKEEQNSLKEVRVSPSFQVPSSSSSLFCSELSSTDRMACVAHAFWMTCLAKNILSALESLTTVPCGSSSGVHLKRKTSPWTTSPSCSSWSRLQSSSTWTPRTPNLLISSVKTPGSLSIRHQLPAAPPVSPIVAKSRNRVNRQQNNKTNTVAEHDSVSHSRNLEMANSARQR